MKLTKGKIVAGERVVSNVRNQEFIAHRFTVETFMVNPEITLGTEVVVAGFIGYDKEALRTLRAYLKDRPALTDDREVKRGIMALNTLLGTLTEDL